MSTLGITPEQAEKLMRALNYFMSREGTYIKNIYDDLTQPKQTVGQVGKFIKNEAEAQLENVKARSAKRFVSAINAIRALAGILVKAGYSPSTEYEKDVILCQDHTKQLQLTTENLAAWVLASKDADIQALCELDKVSKELASSSSMRGEDNSNKRYSLRLIAKYFDQTGLKKELADSIKPMLSRIESLRNYDEPRAL